MSLLSMDFATLASSAGATKRHDNNSSAESNPEVRQIDREDSSQLFPNTSSVELGMALADGSPVSAISAYATHPDNKPRPHSRTSQRDEENTAADVKQLSLDDIAALLDDTSDYESNGSRSSQPFDLEEDAIAERFSPDHVAESYARQHQHGGHDSRAPSLSPRMRSSIGSGLPSSAPRSDESPYARDAADVFTSIARTTDQLEERIRATVGMEGFGPFAVDFSQLRRWMAHLEDTVQLEDDKVRTLSQELAAARAELIRERELRSAGPGRRMMALGAIAGRLPSRSPSEPTSLGSPEEVSAAVKLQTWWRKRREDDLQCLQEKRHRIEAASGHTEPTNIYSSLSQVVRAYRRNLDEDGRKILQRNKVIEEIVKSEEEYVRKLALLIQYFHAPLEKQIAQQLKQNTTCIISPLEHRQIFMNVVDLLSLHAQYLLPIAVECLSNWPSKPLFLSAMFMEIVGHLTAYHEYVGGYEGSLTTLVKLKKQNKRFAKWLSGTEKYPELAGLDLTDYTIMPVQRIPRYVLLLQDLIANTAPNHVDYTNLVNAVVQVKKLAEDINESLATSQNMQKVYQIQDQLIGDKVPNLLSSNRRLVREGSVMLLTDRVHDRELYLFNDAFLLAKRVWQLGSTTKALKFEGVVRLRGCVLEDVAAEGLPLGFRFYYGNNEKRKFLTLLVASVEEKADWMRDVTNCIAERMPVGPSGIDRSFPMAAELKSEKIPALSGTLMKMEGSFIKTWKERWIHVTSSGILYSYQDKEAYMGSTPPLRSYILSRFMLKELYVTDSMARYVVHLIQKNGGARQIILSTFSKECMETWVNGLNNFVDIKAPSSPHGSTGSNQSREDATPAQVASRYTLGVQDHHQQQVSAGHQAHADALDQQDVQLLHCQQTLQQGQQRHDQHIQQRQQAKQLRDVQHAQVEQLDRLLPDAYASPQEQREYRLLHQHQAIQHSQQRRTQQAQGLQQQRRLLDMHQSEQLRMLQDTSEQILVQQAREELLLKQAQQGQQVFQQHMGSGSSAGSTHSAGSAHSIESFSPAGCIQEASVGMRGLESMGAPLSAPSMGSSASNGPTVTSNIDPYGLVTVNPSAPTMGNYGMSPVAVTQGGVDFGMSPVDVASPYPSSAQPYSPAHPYSPSPEQIVAGAYAASMHPASGLAATTLQQQEVQLQKQQELQKQHMQGKMMQASRESLPRRGSRAPTPQDLTFQAKFNLARDELIEQYFTLASGAFIYLSNSSDPKLCIENLFTKGNVVIRVAKIAALHKSKPGILGKGTGGQIELLSGKLVDLSGLLKRKDCFQAIVDVGSRIGRTIRIYRDGVLQN